MEEKVNYLELLEYMLEFHKKENESKTQDEQLKTPRGICYSLDIICSNLDTLEEKDFVLFVRQRLAKLPLCNVLGQEGLYAYRFKYDSSVCTFQTPRIEFLKDLIEELKGKKI